MMNTHRLFKKNTQPDDNTIKQLRALARTYRDRNNELVGQIWELDRKLVENSDEKLIAKRAEITEQLINEDVEQKLKDIINEIKTLEIALYGHSDVGGPSPYVL